MAPLLIGFILSSMMEDNFARPVTLNDGIGFMYQRPGTLLLLVIGLALIVIPGLRRRGTQSAGLNALSPLY